LIAIQNLVYINPYQPFPQLGLYLAPPSFVHGFKVYGVDLVDLVDKPYRPVLHRPHDTHQRLDAFPVVLLFEKAFP
jgi:hypothetical protein